MTPDDRQVRFWDDVTTLADSPLFPSLPNPNLVDQLEQKLVDYKQRYRDAETAPERTAIWQRYEETVDQLPLSSQPAWRGLIAGCLF